MTSFFNTSLKTINLHMPHNVDADPFNRTFPTKFTHSAIRTHR